jgi:hypothetical protein
MALDKHRKPKQLKNSNGLYILLEAVYWTYNIAYLPIKVRVMALDFVQNKAEIKQGWIDIDRLYKTEAECPQR